MHNKVVFHTDKVLHSQGLPTLRFNFRGVALSSGAYDAGQGETDDVVAAIDYITQLYPGVRVLVAGFSFGAWVGLRAACRDARVHAAIALGLPFSTFDLRSIGHCAKPKLFIQGTEDEYSAMTDVERIYPTLPDPKELAWILGANHFFEGLFSAVTQAIVPFLDSKVLHPT